MIKRQGGDDAFFAVFHQRLDPGVGLVDVGHEVAVRQHGGLGHARRAARVLQAGQVVWRERHFGEGGVASGAQRVSQPDGAGQRPGRHHAFDAADHEVDEAAFHRAQHFSDGGHQHALDCRAGQGLLQGGREIVGDHDGARSRVGQLVFKFVRRVERVAVDHDASGAQRAEQADRVLQQIGHHQGDAVAAAQAVGVQPGGETARQLVELRIADRLAHADVRGLVRKAPAAFLDNRHQGRRAIRLDLRGHAGGIALVPDSFHVVRFRLGPVGGSFSVNRP
ncbi:hypothetical protein D3C71_1383290 [compost metagenome]